MKFRRLHACWGFSYPKFAVTPNQSSVKIITNKKIKNPVRERFLINIPRSTRKAMLLDKANDKNYGPKPSQKHELLLSQKEHSGSIPSTPSFQRTSNGKY